MAINLFVIVIYKSYGIMIKTVIFVQYGTN